MQALFREDMFRGEFEDLQRRYQVNQDVSLSLCIFLSLVMVFWLLIVCSD